MAGEPILKIENLALSFRHGQKSFAAMRGVDMAIHAGETVALVGESGSGKSVCALSILKLLPSAHYDSGKIIWRGDNDLLATDGDSDQMRHIRGNRISMIFQEPMTALNPLHTVGRQIAESISIHQQLSAEKIADRVHELLQLVGLSDTSRIARAYPHELSGGQRQRILIAMALANNPDLLIADEPTTALDVMVQEQILSLLIELQKKLGMALLLITHDLNMVKRLANRVYVMRGGLVVEHGNAAQIFSAPKHEYTQLLLHSTPKGLPIPRDPSAATVMQSRDLRVWFPIKKGIFKKTVGHIKAVDGVDFDLRAGQTLGVVGESGSGKTTLGLALLRLVVSRGDITWCGQPIGGYDAAKMRPLRREMQMVFQDPFGALSPRLTVGQIIGEGLSVHNRDLSSDDRESAIAEALSAVGLDANMTDRYPHEFSGGQRQRISIARALVLKPKLVILDEPTSALDMTTQAQIVDLLRDLQRRYGLAYVLISHDLRVVRALAHDILVLRGGVVVERGPADTIFRDPQNEYTRALIKAAFIHE